MENKTIRNLKDYFGWIQELRFSGSFDGRPLNDIIFRGHANKEWSLLSHLAREKCNESEILNKARMRGFPYLKDCKTELEMLIKLQHYGLPTRLLDVTTNPLVALYFACQKNTNPSDGCIRWGHHNDKDGLVFAEMVAHIIFMPDKGNVITEKQMEYLKTNLPTSDIQEITIFDIFSNSVFFFPPHENSRIVAQSGAFLMSALIDKNNRDSDVFFRNIESEDNHSFDDFFEKSYDIIPFKSKDSILQELDECSINQATLFPDLQNITAYIKSTIFKYDNRFDVE